MPKGPTLPGTGLSDLGDIFKRLRVFGSLACGQSFRWPVSSTLLAKRSKYLYHVMFDIDGTLVQSYGFDADCFTKAIKEVLDIKIDDNWSSYEHVTDNGILNEVIQTNGLDSKKVEIQREVKSSFIRRLREHLKIEPAHEVPGAASFLARLQALNNVSISIATGGWYESAVLKLQSAGISIHNIPVASSDDHYSRTKIMKIAEERANNNTGISNTYFGDEVWDKKACQELGYNFVLVGNSVPHDQSIVNFNSTNKAMTYIGL